MKKAIDRKRNYRGLVEAIGIILRQARHKAFQDVDRTLTRAYWQIGRHIVVYEQENDMKADYGSELLDRIAHDLRKKYGRGFSRSNVFNFRRLYLDYPKIQSVPGFLSWTHIVALLSVDDNLARRFYERECAANRWSTRELERQIDSMLFERLALSKNKKGVMKLAAKGHIIDEAHDVVKNPYILEFLGLSEDYKHTEMELEQKIIDNMQSFLLELGKGFSFVSRQYRVSFGNKHLYIDLVFYNRILRCFVLIDLKIGAISHQDIGQMNLYLNYFKKEEMLVGDNEPIGIVLGAEKHHILVEYALGGISNKLFASKYRLSLPDKRLLRKAVERVISGDSRIRR